MATTYLCSVIKNFSIIIALLCSVILFACGQQERNESTSSSQTTSEQLQASQTAFVMPEVPVLRYENLLDILSQDLGDTVTLVNFWATWCQPCIKELPHFHELVAELKAKNAPIKFVMVSIDKASELEPSVSPFLEKNQYGHTQFLLDDNGRMNEWIPKINTNWEGEIPATAVYKNGQQQAFISGMISKAQLNDLLAPYL